MNIKKILGISLVLTLPLLFPSPAFAVIQNLNTATGMNQSFVNDTNVKITTSPTANSHTLGWDGVLSVLRGGTGANSFNNGSLLFFNGSTFSENNSKLFMLLPPIVGAESLV